MNWIEYRIAKARNGETSELDLSRPGWRVEESSDILTEFPQEILDFQHLTKLSLANHDLRTLPPGIARLDNLQELELSGNENLVLPNEICKLEQLRTLKLWGVESLARMEFSPPPGLESLDVSLTGLESLPGSILRLEKLADLDLSFCDFPGIPQQLRHMRSLRSLGLPNINGFAPGDLGGLAKSLPLTGLWLPADRRELLEELAAFTGLEKLRVRRSELDGIPKSWLKLPLRSFSLEPDSTGREEKVNGLDDIIRLPGLKELRIEGQLDDAAFSALWNHKHLTALTLIKSGIDGFPREVLGFSELESLTLGGANISQVPAEICRLSKLKHFNLSGNPIRQLPQEIASLQNLVSLWLSGTKIEKLPQSVVRLRTLKSVSLNGAPLAGWPHALDALSGLETVVLSRTGISEIPAGSVRSWPLLKHLAVERNPITSPPPEITARGTASIQGWFSALEESKTTPLYEAKLIIIGEGDVGKTCIGRKLVDPGYDIAKDRDNIGTTKGIAVVHWQAETGITKSFKVNLWDFGGQEIYHATHQFFLTRRSLYLFVWEARKDERVEAFDYWLNVVKLLTSGSPVIVVQNKADVRIKGIDQNALTAKFRNIAAFHKVSALTGLGMPELVRDIRANLVKLPHVGDPWPGSWSIVREALEQDPRNYMEYTEYLEMCRKEGLEKSQGDLLSQYLHDLGVILHFQDDAILRETVILKPEWGTNAVYAVLDTKKVQTNRGRFSRADLQEIWSRTVYPPSKHVELLQLMMKFELCFPLEGLQEYIAPELLSGEPPQLDWDPKDNLLFEYHYGFMPAGIMTRFIARNYASIEGERYWKNGAVLSWEGTRALITSDALTRKIRVAVSGRDKKGMLAVVRREFAHIHDTLNKPEVKQMIPCICELCKLGEPFLFEHARVVHYYDGGLKEITCDRSLKQVSIEGLLSGVFTKNEIQASGKTQDARTVIVYGDYIEERGENMGKRQEPAAKGPWISGSFYLLSIVAVIVLLAAIAQVVSAWILPVVILGGLLAVTVIGALQLKQDERLSEKGFLTLMTLAFRQIPLLGKLAKSE